MVLCVKHKLILKVENRKILLAGYISAIKIIIDKEQFLYKIFAYVHIFKSII